MARVLVLPLLCALALIGCAVSSEEAVTNANPNAPRRALLAFSRELDGDLVAGRNVTVKYVIANVGTGAATSISFKDLSFPLSRFTLHTGTFRHSLGSLAASVRTSHSVLMTPKRAGELLVSPASLSYVDETGTAHVAKLAAADSVLVEDALAYRRRTDSHRFEWSLYALAFALLVVAPALVGALVERGIVTDDHKKKSS